MTKRIFILLAFLLGTCSFYFGTNQNKLTSLLKESNNSEYSLPKKLKLAEDIIAISNNDSNALLNAYSNIGSIYLTHSLYKEAIRNFEKSATIAKELRNDTDFAYNSYLLGNTYMYLKDFDRAQEYYNVSKKVFKSLNQYRFLGMIHNSQGIIFLEKQNTNLAYQAFSKSYEIFDSLNLDYEKSYPLTNIGDYFLKVGEPDSAIKCFEATLALDALYKDFKSKAISLGNLGLAYQQKNQYSRAITFFNQSLALAEKHEYNKVIYDNYLDLSETYKLKNDFKNSLIFYEKYTSLKDSIIGAETKEGIANMHANYENERKEKELLIQKTVIDKLEYSEKISRLKTYIIICCFLVLLISSVFVVLRLKNNLKRKYLEESLIKAELNFQESESKRLSNELEKTNKDLTNFALDIARKNEFTQDIDIKLKQIKKATSPENKEVLLQELIFKTHNHLKTNEDFERFQSNIKKVNHDFFEKLAGQFDALTNNEIHLCGLIRLGLTIKDIASIKNISPKSVEMNRYRLRKKLPLMEGEDLYQFLTKL